MANDVRNETLAARQALNTMIGDIRSVPRHGDFLAPPTFDDITDAARTQPLVYIAAASVGGLALIVRDGDVEHIALPDVTDTYVEDLVTTHMDIYQAFRRDRVAGRGAWRASLAAVTSQLWDTVVGPVMDAVTPADAITVVAGGLLNLVPLHAAWTEAADAPTGRRYALDLATISYAPNARSLIVARDRATAAAATALLAVADTRPAEPASRLPLAMVEAKAAAAGFAGHTVTLDGPSARIDTVRAELQRADVVHLACHGFADLSQPLDSGVWLADGVLRLGDLFSMQVRLRLAVLSACETFMPGTDLPDEVVALPTGLLQAGAAGVMAPMWAVPDLATAMLMTEFYRRWRWEGITPAVALRQSQQWLRDTTNADKQADYHAAQAQRAGWLPADVAEAFLDDVMFRDPQARDHAELEMWAAFAHIGV